jgi:hypothetical protein
MKKLLLFAFIIGGSFAVMSCGKDECECTVNGTTDTFDEDDVSSGSVSDACNAADALLTSPDECHMK